MKLDNIRNVYLLGDLLDKLTTASEAIHKAAVFPNAEPYVPEKGSLLLASELISVQPMPLPTGLLHYIELDYEYASRTIEIDW